MGRFDDFDKGQPVVDRRFTISRADLRAYAEASGDHNPIHLDEQAARDAGLPDVITHGMYTLGLAARAISEWLDDAGLTADVSRLSGRFARPVVVSADDGGAIDVEAKVRRVDDDELELAVTVSSEGNRVLAPARITCRAA
ncbi:MaoC/PaaZ C-terminal domain-containing protein [Haloglycomyces albus]|uniref:MaoC/PaaZ C-terminal domain-containing protein n=1 Tax=Haloglycomyces albus TaxID=526067 RepID=UPI00046D258B|nr:MaoC/PaaZ C-terminal domain-containing protein [Haloglycomyces albus]